MCITIFRENFELTEKVKKHCTMSMLRSQLNLQPKTHQQIGRKNKSQEYFDRQLRYIGEIMSRNVKLSQDVRLRHDEN